MEGWIKLHRQLIESEVFASPVALKVWVWLLCKARYVDGYANLQVGAGDKTIFLKRGQLLFGRFTAEEQLSLPGTTIYRWIKKFEQPMNMIKITSNNHFTVITILNFPEYNDDVDNQRPAGEQQMDNRRIPDGQQMDTNNKDKKDNKDKKEEKEPRAREAEFLSQLETYREDCLSRQIWSEKFCITTGVSLADLPKLLDDFNAHAIAMGKNIPDLPEYQNYLTKWKLNKDTIMGDKAALKPGDKGYVLPEYTPR